MDCSHQASLSMRFFRQEYWSGLPCLEVKGRNSRYKVQCLGWSLHFIVFSSYITLFDLTLVFLSWLFCIHECVRHQFPKVSYFSSTASPHFQLVGQFVTSLGWFWESPWVALSRTPSHSLSVSIWENVLGMGGWRDPALCGICAPWVLLSVREIMTIQHVVL